MVKAISVVITAIIVYLSTRLALVLLAVLVVIRLFFAILDYVYPRPPEEIFPIIRVSFDDD